MSHLRESGFARAEVATLIYAMSNEPDLFPDRIHIEEREISARGKQSGKSVFVSAEPLSLRI
jgi:hypothetical protein